MRRIVQSGQSSAGEQIGKYTVLGEVGRGGMGVVYLARDPDLDREVALKVLRADVSGDDRFVARFEREARAVARLFHPNVLPVNALSRVDGCLVIEMPYIAGGSLAGLMARQGLRCPHITCFCADALSALAACHGAGMVHRDVKPSNLLLDGEGRALLADFGVAQVGEGGVPGQEDTATSMFVGTPRYAPLEAWDGVAPSPAWDLYSVGVMLYEGLSGQRFVEADTVLGHIHALERGVAPAVRTLREDVSEPLGDLVARLTAADPGARPASAQEALDALRDTPEACEGRTALDTTQQGPRPRPPRLRVPRTRRIGRILATAAVVALVALGLLFGLAGSHDHGAAAPTQPEVDTIQAYRVSVAGSAGDPAWALLRKPAEGGPAEALLFGDLWCAAFTATPVEDGSLGISGRWGRFEDRWGMSASAGGLAGAGQWLAPDVALALSLTYADPAQALRWEEALNLSRAEETPAAVLARLESDEYLLPLAVNELIPRDAAWEDLLLAWLKESAAARLSLVDAREAPFSLDGAQGEFFWAGAPALEIEEGARLQGALTTDGILLFCVGPRGMTAPHLDVALQPRPRVPLSATPRYSGAFEAGDWVSGSLAAGGDTRPWEVTWRAAEGSTDGMWCAEFVLPFSPDEAEAPEFWRLNVALSEGDAPMVRWGAGTLEDTAHGLLLHRADP